MFLASIYIVCVNGMKGSLCILLWDVGFFLFGEESKNIVILIFFKTVFYFVCRAQIESARC